MSSNIGNFKYSHTIHPPQNQLLKEQQDLQALFKIGSSYINRQQSIESHEGQLQYKSNSRSRSRNRSRSRKHKKHKEGKQKKSKKEKKDKKEKKEKKQRKHKKQHSRHQNKHAQVEEVALCQPKSQNPTNYPDNQQIKVRPPSSAYIDNYYTNVQQARLSEKLNSKFAYNQQLGKGCLNFSVVNFPIKGLAEHGPQTSQIPLYSRCRCNYIVGMGSNRQTEQLLTVLNKIISQRSVQKQKQQPRYFSFTNIDQVEGESVKHLRTRHNSNQSFIAFDSSLWADVAPPILSLKSTTVDYRLLDVSDAELLRLNKDYNLQLSRNPKDITTWLRFISIQDKLGGWDRKPNTRVPLLERKLSIIQKALQNNPDETKLMVLQLQIIFKLQKQHYHRNICSKAIQYLQRHPSSIQLWQTYLDFKFSNFTLFTNSLLRKQVEQITTFLKRKVSQATSAVMIWNIRKASLYVLSRVVSMTKMSGYNQLSTGACQALLEYNIFIPQTINQSNDYSFRASAFKNYWQNYSIFRLGQLDTPDCWETYCLSQFSTNPATYIGIYQNTQYFQSKVPPSGSFQNSWEYRQFHSQFLLSNWRPTHTTLDDQRIQLSPQSFVLFQDIQHLLHIYRDQQNLQLLVDTVFQLLNFPPVYNHHYNLQGEYISFYIYKRLCAKLNSIPQIGDDILELWNHFWHPCSSELFLEDPNWAVRLIYIKRLLSMLRLKMQRKEPIAIYQIFIQTVIYLNPTLLSLVYGGNVESCKSAMSTVLQQDPTNIKVWISYIQGQHIKNNNTKECCQVYKQLLSSEGLTRKKIYYILYHFYQSLKRWSEQTTPALIYLFDFLKQHKVSDHRPRQHLQPMEILQLMNLLCQRYSLFQHKQPKSGYGHLTSRHIISYFVLQLCNKYEPTQHLSCLAEAIKTRLSVEVANPMSCIIALNSDTTIKLTPLQQSSEVHLPYIQLLVKYFKQPLFLIKQYLTNYISDIRLSHWMACISYIRSSSSRVFQLFFQYGKEVARADGMCRQITFTILFAKLLTSHQYSPAFLLLVLNHIPYSKDLFLLYLTKCPATEQYRRIKQAILAKQLRILHHYTQQ